MTIAPSRQSVFNRSVPPSGFYNRCPLVVARHLIGKLLCRRSRDGVCIGRIVETEAYLAADDSASHSVDGPNRKNACMFGPAGLAYVYTIHARQCFNIVTEPNGIGSAVLIRAVEPLHGIPLMQRRRRKAELHDLCRGPARLCEAFNIGRKFNGWDLSIGRRLWIADQDEPAEMKIGVTPRIGVTSAEQLLLRFVSVDSRLVSGTRRQNQTWLSE